MGSILGARTTEYQHSNTEATVEPYMYKLAIDTYYRTKYHCNVRGDSGCSEQLGGTEDLPTEQVQRGLSKKKNNLGKGTKDKENNRVLTKKGRVLSSSIIIMDRQITTLN